MKGTPWPDDALAELRRRYPHEPTAAIAADLGVSINACYSRAAAHGIKKSTEYLNGPFACRLRRDDSPGMGTRFQPGLVPHNKGVKGWQAGGRAHETKFKPGNTPHTELPVGSYRLNKQGTLQQKIGTAKGSNSKRWRGVHELVWVAAHGPLPAGHICVFKPGLRTNVLDEITLDRVECIPLAENMRRNSYHTRYPKEVGRAIQLLGALNRKINHATKDPAP